MDNKIAYKLATIGTHYDLPEYCEDEKKPWFYNYCRWSNDTIAGLNSGIEVIRNYGQPDEHNVKKYIGKLREELFDTIELKINYIKGIFDSYSGRTLEKDQTLRFANSLTTVWRVNRWLSDICHEKNILGDVYVKTNAYGNSIPMINHIILSEDIINYINNTADDHTPSEYISWPEFVSLMESDNPKMVNQLYRLNKHLTNTFGELKQEDQYG